jgi:hypothetical protein
LKARGSRKVEWADATPQQRRFWAVAAWIELVGHQAFVEHLEQRLDRICPYLMVTTSMRRYGLTGQIKKVMHGFLELGARPVPPGNASKAGVRALRPAANAFRGGREIGGNLPHFSPTTASVAIADNPEVFDHVR